MVVGTSEEMFQAVSSDTWEGEKRKIGLETHVVRMNVVWDTGGGKKLFVGDPRRCLTLYLVTSVRMKIESGET